jgi:hypothetical protein
MECTWTPILSNACLGFFTLKHEITNFAFDITIYIIFINVCSSKKFYFSTNNEYHNLDTRQRNNLYLPQANLTIYQKGVYYSGIKIFNNLPLEIKKEKKV